MLLCFCCHFQYYYVNHIELNLLSLLFSLLKIFWMLNCNVTLCIYLLYKKRRKKLIPIGMNILGEKKQQRQPNHIQQSNQVCCSRPIFSRTTSRNLNWKFCDEKKKLHEIIHWHRKLYIVHICTPHLFLFGSRMGSLHTFSQHSNFFSIWSQLIFRTK